MKKSNLFILALAGVSLVACNGSSGSGGSSGGGGGGNTGDLSKLNATAPISYPAGIMANVPLVLTNNGTTTINNLSYVIESSANTTGANITISPSSAANCKEIAAQKSCQLIAQIAANPPSNSGSFAITASQNSNTTAKQRLSVSSSQAINATIGLVTVPNNSLSGANGINISFPSAIITNMYGITSMIVTAMVISPNAGDFNTIQLVDGSGNILDYNVLSQNSGGGFGKLLQGSIVSLQVIIPSGVGQIQFKVQTAQDNTIVSTASDLHTTKVVSSAVKTGILNLTPNYFDLSASHESQIITLTNSGNGPISNLKLATQSHLTVINNNCGTILSPDASCQYTLKFNNQDPVSGEVIINFTYNDGTSEQHEYATATVTNQVSAKYIFVTSAFYTGNMGGFTGADAKCTALGLTGSVTKNVTGGWKALLNGNNATTSGVEYKNTKGFSLGVATSGNFIAPSVNAGDGTFPFDENGENVNWSWVWTGAANPVVTDGSSVDCLNWTSTDYTGGGGGGVESASIGKPTVISSSGWWLGGQLTCDFTASLYCAQQ